MKKVISVTLNGIIFMIEEDALQKLSTYLDSIKRHYGPDGKEITDDIEANIAEKFRAKNEGKERAIKIEEVEEVIGVMGTVDQMEDTEEKDETEYAGKEEREPDSKKVKRLYRDDENAIIGGVCTGLAAYFSIDVVIVRLIFVALTILNGIGIAIYLVMWLIVPLAKTSMQKLEMQGEPINLKNIEEVVKEKSEQLRDNSQKAYVSLKEKKSVIIKILSFPIVMIEALVRFLRGIGNIILPIIRYAIGIFMVMGVFLSFIFTSFWAIIFLFKNDSPLLRSDIPISLIAGTKAFIISVISVYSSIVILLIFVFLLAISIMSKKMILNWLAGTVLFVCLTLSITVASVYGFELASEIKATYDKYISENMTEKVIDIANFNAVSGEMRGNLKIEKGEFYSVVLKGLKSDIERMEFIKEATSSEGIVNLLINKKDVYKSHGAVLISKPLELIITMPELKQIDPSNFWGYDLKGFDNEEELLKAYISEEEYENEILGADKEARGCRTDSGFVWCASKQDCIRPWEEVCESDIDFSATGIAKKVPSKNGEGLYLVYEDEMAKEAVIKLDFDEKSLCGDSENQIVCMALSVSDYGLVDGLKISVRGEDEGELIKVRELIRLGSE